MGENTIPEILTDFEGYNELDKHSKKIVNNNFKDLIGSLTIVVDSQLFEKEKSFLKRFITELIGLKTEEFRKIINEPPQKDIEFLNYKDDKSEYLEYTGTIRSININVDNCIEKSNDDDNLIPQNLEMTKNERTIILLSNRPNENEAIYSKYINKIYNKNALIYVVDYELPDPIKELGKAVSRVLNYNFDRMEIEESIEYISTDNQLKLVSHLIQEDINEKLNNKDQLELSLEQFENAIIKIQEDRRELISLARKYKRESKNSIDTNLNKQSSVENIIQMIEYQNVRKKRKEQKVFAEKFLEKKVKTINNEIKYKVDKYNEKFEEILEAINISYNEMTGLKYKNNISSWFTSGLLGVGSYGALALYMSSLGNLGGYILVAKGVGLLSTFGISVGGVATAAKTVSLLGGPIGIAIGAGLGTALLSKSLLGIGWKKSLAKKIRKTSEKNAMPLMKENSDKLWDQTIETVTKGFDGLIKNYQNDLLKTYKDKLSEEEKKKINEIVEKYKK